MKTRIIRDNFSKETSGFREVKKYENIGRTVSALRLIETAALSFLTTESAESTKKKQNGSLTRCEFNGFSLEFMRTLTCVLSLLMPDPSTGGTE